MNNNYLQTVKKLIEEHSATFDYSKKITSIILAAGHGKRIKSNTSKMLHKIWEVPTVNRVVEACQKGIPNSNIIVVVGIKADDVTLSVGQNSNTLFAFQEVQNGTGHAVQVALEKIPNNYDGTVFVLPGDMGLIDSETVNSFKNEFENSKADMMVLTGIYDGPIEENQYGRIIRVKDKDAKGVKSKFKGKVIQIMEYKDILQLDKKKPYSTKFKKKTFNYTRSELLENREFNSGVYAFKFKPLAELIKKLQSNNAQAEIYITDLIALFNENGYCVEAVSPAKQYVLMGFNNKSVLKEMDSIARKLIYDKIKDVLLIEDPNDFFIAEDVVEELLTRDKQGDILDIEIGKGVYIGRGAKLGSKIILKKNVHIEGKVEILGECLIDEGTQILGSESYPTIIGKGAKLKGLNYVVGTIIEDEAIVMHSILVNQKVQKKCLVKFLMPEKEGVEKVTSI